MLATTYDPTVLENLKDRDSDPDIEIARAWRLDKLDALLAQSSTSAQDAALFAEMLSLPNEKSDQYKQWKECQGRHEF